MPKIVETDESMVSLSNAAYEDFADDSNPKNRRSCMDRDDYDLLDECRKSARRVLRQRKLTAGELRTIIVEEMANNVWGMI